MTENAMLAVAVAVTGGSWAAVMIARVICGLHIARHNAAKATASADAAAWRKHKRAAEKAANGGEGS